MLINYNEIARLMFPIQQMPLGALIYYKGEQDMVPCLTLKELEELKGTETFITWHPDIKEVISKRYKFYTDLIMKIIDCDHFRGVRIEAVNKESLRPFGSKEKDLVLLIEDNGYRYLGDQGCFPCFVLSDSSAVLQEPRNNDGRNICFWCNVKTEKKQGFSNFWDVCPKCGR